MNIDDFSYKDWKALETILEEYHTLLSGQVHSEYGNWFSMVRTMLNKLSR